MSPRDRELLLRARALRAAPPTQAVPSPCLSVCRMDPEQALCAGCLRSIEEIAGWGGMSEADKRGVWTRIEQRARGEESR